MTGFITDLLKQAVDSGAFKHVTDKSQAIHRYREVGTPENRPSNRARFATAIQPTAEALHILLDSNLHKEAVSTIIADEQSAMHSITVRFDKVRHQSRGAAAEVFARNSLLLPLHALTLRFTPVKNVIPQAQIELTLPFWEVYRPSVRALLLRTFRTKKYAVVTFGVNGEVHCPLGFPGATDFVAGQIPLLSKYIEGIAQSGRLM